MGRTSRNRSLVSAALLAALCALGAPREAAAQAFIQPFFGYNFGGDSGCPDITGCEDKGLNWGFSFGAIGGWVGGEGEFSFTDHFFGEASNNTSSVATFMGNLLLAPRFGPVQPFGAIGLGVIKTEVEATGDTGLSPGSQNDFGWDGGGGLMIFFGRHVGVRGEIRYFHAFDVLDLLNVDASSETKLDFGRTSLGVMFKF